jgi:hypothetical protein
MNQINLLERDPADIKVLVGCERSKVVRNAFLALGFDAYSCDTLEAEGGNDNRHIQDDIRQVMKYGEWDLLTVMHPPCTRLCNSGVRWLTGDKLPKGVESKAQLWAELDEGARLFSDCWNVPNIKHVAVENPVMHKYAKMRIENFQPAAQHVQPWEFGEPFFKSTGLYLRELPKLQPVNPRTDVPKKKDEPERHAKWSAIHHASPGKDRANIRSRTFQGIADAIASQWGNFVLQVA